MINIWGYLRVSTEKQELENNKLSILKLANDKELGGPVKFIEEKVSGKKDWRKRLLGEYFEKSIKDGDILIMSEISRISRNFMDSIEFLACCKRRNIQVYSVIGDIPQNTDSMAILVTSLNAWKSQVERENLSIRTKNALRAKKEKGIILGRRKGSMVLEKYLDDNKKDISKLLKDGVKLKFISQKFNCTVMTLTKFIKKYDLKLIIKD